MKKMENETWNQIKQFYKDKFDVEPALVDIMADYDIIKLCATGASNKSIANILKLEPYDVSCIIDKRLGFKGWTNDLKFNPLQTYKNLDTNDFLVYEDYVVTRYGYESGILEMSFSVARIASELERLINEKWI